MINVTFEDNRVTDSDLARLQRERRGAKGMAAYGRFNAWSHYSSLKNYQRQGFHCAYLGSSELSYCSCGLVAPLYLKDADLSELISASVKKKVISLKLNPVHFFKGHVNLPSFDGQSVSLITNNHWVKSMGIHVWDAFCQECGEIIAKEDWSDALTFVKEHNELCQIL